MLHRYSYSTRTAAFMYGQPRLGDKGWFCYVLEALSESFESLNLQSVVIDSATYVHTHTISSRLIHLLSEISWKSVLCQQVICCFNAMLTHLRLFQAYCASDIAHSGWTLLWNKRNVFSCVLDCPKSVIVLLSQAMLTPSMSVHFETSKCVWQTD